MATKTYTHVSEIEFTNDLGERIVVITCIAEQRTECAKRIGGWVSCPCCGADL